LQTKGDGPIRLMVADVTSGGDVRGYAQFDATRLAALTASAGAGLSVPRLLGAGHLAFTVDQGEHTERYQGIVELQGATLTECAHHYFRQSEQIQAGIKTAVGRDPVSKAWRAGAIMLQRLPSEGLDAFARGVGRFENRLGRVFIESNELPVALGRLLKAVFHRFGARMQRMFEVFGAICGTFRCLSHVLPRSRILCCTAALRI